MECEREAAPKLSFGGIFMCGNNNGICGCLNNNLWWIIILVLLLCNTGCGNGCERDNGCGCGC